MKLTYNRIEYTLESIEKTSSGDGRIWVGNERFILRDKDYIIPYYITITTYHQYSNQNNSYEVTIYDKKLKGDDGNIIKCFRVKENPLLLGDVFKILKFIKQI
jgi:hypothetical protein